MQLGNLMLFVPDLTEARRFYRDVLGMRLVAEAADHLRFALAGSELVLFRCEKPGAVGDYSNEARAVIVFAVPSVSAALGELRRLGVQCLHDHPAVGPLGSYAAFVDPFGIVHEIAESSPAPAEAGVA